MDKPQTNGLMRACAIFLLAGCLLLAAGFLAHPEESPSNDAYRETVAHHEGAARTSHYLILAGLLALACAGPIAAAGGVRTGASAGQIVGPLLVMVGALAALPVAAIEATVVPDAAAAGDAAAFDSWGALGFAFLPGFLVLALGFAVVAFAEARGQAGAMRALSNGAGALSLLTIVGWAGAYFAGVWALNVLSYAFLGVLLYNALGAGMEVFGRGQGHAGMKSVA